MNVFYARTVEDELKMAIQRREVETVKREYRRLNGEMSESRIGQEACRDKKEEEGEGCKKSLINGLNVPSFPLITSSSATCHFLC